VRPSDRRSPPSERLDSDPPGREINVAIERGEVSVEAADRVAGGEDGRLKGRVASVDALRGLTILLMIFVNDLGPHAPAWMHHIQPSNADGMTLADIVFPAFLFIVGVSIPLAIERGPKPWPRRFAQLGHIAARTLGLLFMGLVQLNADGDRTLRGPLWELLAFTALICAWCSVPRERGMKRMILIALKAAGILGLIALLAIFRSTPRPTDVLLWGRIEDWAWLHTEWWGILGLIGWAYLTAALVWLVLGSRREWLMGAVAILIWVHLAMQRGGLFGRLDHKPWLGGLMPVFKSIASGISWIDQYVSIADATGSLAAISVAGCLLGNILRKNSDVVTQRDRLSWAFTFTIVLWIAGFVTDTFEGINKIAATPTWCLWSAALACAAWMVLYLIIDVAGLRRWTIVVRPAGANPLVAYFLHPIAVELISVLGLHDRLLGYHSSADPYVVVGGSLVMALLVCLMTGVLGRLGFAVRL
jgi:heparan-alpha-glucosaminide N-acetyltransferase